jgi:transketolase
MVELNDFAKVFTETLVKVGEKHANVVVVDADLPDSCGTESFRRRFPDRAWDIGIAEQSLPTVSAGLALCGLVPIYNSFAVFAVHRGVDMIRQSICYNRANVKIVGHAAGQSMGYTGPSHHTLEDIALLRALPGMTILQPADGIELAQMMFAMVEHDGPVYLRVPRVVIAPTHGSEYRFQIGQPDLIKPGRDMTFFVTGDPLRRVLALAGRLEREQGISAQVVNIPTIKPLDVNAVVRLGRNTRAAVTVEDHNVFGGLGGAIAEIYGEHLQQPVRRVGITDTFTESADGAALQNRYGLSDEAICGAALAALRVRDAPQPAFTGGRGESRD